MFRQASEKKQRSIGGGKYAHVLMMFILAARREKRVGEQQLTGGQSLAEMTRGQD
jgi:hypothetical protein